MRNGQTEGVRTSWDVEEEDVHDELATLMALSDEEIAVLGRLRDEAVRVAPGMAEAFYDRLLAHEHTAAYFDEGSMDDRHDTIASWFVDLFGAPTTRRR